MFIFKIVIMLYRYMYLSKFVTIWLMGRAVHHPVANVAMEKLVILWTVRALMGVQKAQQEISVNTVWQFCSLHAFRCLIVFTLLKKAGIFNYICDKKWQIDIISMSTVSLGCPLGYYGKNCLNQCSKNCNFTRRCDSVTGQCDGGCKPGWVSITCDQSKCVLLFSSFEFSLWKVIL